MTYIPEALRRDVRIRAHNRCEYCRLPERFTLKKHEVDHIRAEKHDGATVIQNLCLSCFDCNRHKGSDLSSIDPLTDEIVPLFHPRNQVWAEHFAIMPDGTIRGMSPVGRVTVRLLNMNDPERVTLRLMVAAVEAAFPSET